MSSWGVPGYTEGRELGRGASGRVVEATSEATGQRVAIKYLSASMVGDPEYMARFREEARLLTELDVPQVVRLLAYVEEPGAGAAIVMELVDGVSLHELISRQGATGPESALAVLKGSLLGLAAAHSLGIVHRDYKPENVLVDVAGASKLADFGVAVRAGHRVPAAGTPLYMAPEQWAGEPASPATDIYAATAVFYECLTGRTPFSGRLRQLRGQHERAAVPSADVDEPLRPLVERGMAKDPAARPVNAATFVAELDATAAAAYGPDWEQRGRGQLAARAAALLLLLLHGRPVAGSAPATDAVTWLLRRKKAVLGVIAVVVAGAVAIAGAAIASQTTPPHHTITSTSFTLPRQPVVTASATATPPAAAGSCKNPTAFTYSATLAADQPGTLTYRWVYSSGTKNGRPRIGATANRAVRRGRVAARVRRRDQDQDRGHRLGGDRGDQPGPRDLEQGRLPAHLHQRTPVRGRRRGRGRGASGLDRHLRDTAAELHVHGHGHQLQGRAGHVLLGAWRWRDNRAGDAAVPSSRQDERAAATVHAADRLGDGHGGDRRDESGDGGVQHRDVHALLRRGWPRERRGEAAARPFPCPRQLMSARRPAPSAVPSAHRRSRSRGRSPRTRRPRLPTTGHSIAAMARSRR